MSLGTPSTPALLSLARIPPLVNFHKGSIQESLTTILWGKVGRCDSGEGAHIDAAQTVVPRPCRASEMKMSWSRMTSVTSEFPSHATNMCFLPSLSQNIVSSNPICPGGARERPTRICKNSLGHVWISMGAVEGEPPLSKNVRTILCPNIQRQGAECLPSWAYKSSAVFPATSVYDCFMVFVDFWAFISPTTLMSLQSSCFDLTTSDGTRTRSGFQLAADPFKGMVAPSTTQVLGAYVKKMLVKWRRKSLTVLF